MRNDFEVLKIEVPSSKIKPEKIYRPTNEEIVERARYWFGLMKKRKLIHRY
jgi:hypothetical protein